MIFQSHRHFQTWRYLVSHGQLLMRSTPTENEPSRVELLFRYVHAVKLSVTLDNIAIRQASPSELTRINEDIGESVTDLELNAFMIESSKSTGYVVARSFAWVEDDGDYKTPSSLLIGE